MTRGNKKTHTNLSVDELHALENLHTLLQKRIGRHVELRIIRHADGSGMCQVNDGVQYVEPTLRLAVSSALAGEVLK